MRRDGSVVSWGAPKHGGDCSAVQSRLSDVQQIQASGGDKLSAFFLFIYLDSKRGNFKLFGLIYWLYLRKFKLLGARLLRKRDKRSMKISAGVPFLLYTSVP